MSDVSLGPGTSRVQGGAAGVLYQPPETRFSVRLASRVDDALVTARGETVEAVLVSVGVDLP